ncbi:hypothetical protein Droror1_Dr00027090 [Drosera rotundifolia]
MLVELWLNSEDEELEVFGIDEQVAHGDGLACSSCLVCSWEPLRYCCRSWVAVDGLKLRLEVVRVGGRAAAYRNRYVESHSLGLFMVCWRLISE